MVMVLTDEGTRDAPNGRAEGERLWQPEAELEALTGWALKPEGFCRGETCVPLPPGRKRELRHGGRVDAAGFWRHLGWPVLRSEDGTVWVLGEGAAERARALQSLQAPDFTLPDPAGRMHSLSEHRGKKVFLVSWASW